jgi:hypothetical protein
MCCFHTAALCFVLRYSHCGKMCEDSLSCMSRSMWISGACVYNKTGSYCVFKGLSKCLRLLALYFISLGIASDLFVSASSSFL